MRNIQIALIIVFLLVAVAFGFTFGYQQFFADNEPPVFVCDVPDLTVSVSDPEQALCRGLRAVDDVDGDLTDRIQVKGVSNLIGANTAQVSYVVFDRASNAATFTRTITYTDYQKPRFTLSKPLVYNVSQTVTLLDRLSVSDVIDGDLTDKMRLSMLNLQTYLEGTYQIRVMVTNSLGDSAILPLSVIIRSPALNAPSIELSDYLVYTPVGAELDARSFITTVKDPLARGEKPGAEDVTISSDVNYQIPGTYEITYSYTGVSGLSYSVILTVVVE